MNRFTSRVQVVLNNHLFSDHSYKSTEKSPPTYSISTVTGSKFGCLVCLYNSYRSWGHMVTISNFHKQFPTSSQLMKPDLLKNCIIHLTTAMICSMTMAKKKL